MLYYPPTGFVGDVARDHGGALDEKSSGDSANLTSAGRQMNEMLRILGAKLRSSKVKFKRLAPNQHQRASHPLLIHASPSTSISLSFIYCYIPSLQPLLYWTAPLV